MRREVMIPSAPSPLFLLAGAGVILVAIGSVLTWQRCTRPAWPYVGIGALAWTAGVALKFAWAIPTNKPVLSAITRLLGPDLGPPAGWLYTGLLTGVFECGATWVFVKKTRVREADPAQAVAFGLGFGAIEALLVGVVTLVAFGIALLAFQHLPTDAQEKLLEGTSSPWMTPLPIVERVSAIASHTVSCVLIVWSVQRRRAVWFWVSFAYKTLIDGFAAWGIERFQVKTSITHLAEFNAIFAAYVAVSVVLMVALARQPARPIAPPHW